MNNRFLDPVGLLQAISGRLPPIPLAQIDCDELTAFLLAFAVFLEMPAEVVTVAADRARPAEFTHVYLKLQHKEGGTIPFDLTTGPYPGFEPGRVYRRRSWPIETPIDLSDVPSSDRATAEAVATVIAAARTAASHPEFQQMLGSLAQWLLEGLSGLIRQEEERRAEIIHGSRESPGADEPAGEPFFRDLSETDLRSLLAWLAHCLAGLRSGPVDLRGLLGSWPELSTPATTAVQTAEQAGLILERLLAQIDTSTRGGTGTRQEM